MIAIEKRHRDALVLPQNHRQHFKGIAPVQLDLVLQPRPADVLLRSREVAFVDLHRVQNSLRP